MALLKRGDDGLVEVAPGCFFDPLTGERRARLPKSKLDYGTSILTLDILGMSPASGVGPSVTGVAAMHVPQVTRHASNAVTPSSFVLSASHLLIAFAATCSQSLSVSLS